MYLVERYAPRPAAGTPSVPEQVPVGLGGTDQGIRHVLSTLIPGDEISLSLFEAPSERALTAAFTESGLPFVRIVEALVHSGEGYTTPAAVRP
jgi:hypothetical protein